MIVHDHKIYGYCKWLRISAITVAMAILFFSMVKAHAWPEPFEIELLAPELDHMKEQAEQKEAREALDRINEGKGSEEDKRTWDLWFADHMADNDSSRRDDNCGTYSGSNSGWERDS